MTMRFSIGAVSLLSFALAGCGGTAFSGNAFPPAALAPAALRPLALPHDQLYIANASNVAVYAPGHDTPTQKITNGIDKPQGMAMDASGNLYVANYGGTSTDMGSVTEYAPNNANPKRTITDGIDKPVALTTDSAGNVYVANNQGGTGTGSIAVYAPGKTSPLRTITASVSHPKGVQSITLDPSNNVYLANANNVTMYKANSTKLNRKFSSNVSGPVQVDIDFLLGVNVVNSTGGNVTIYSATTGAQLNTLASGHPVSMVFLHPGGAITVANNQSNVCDNTTGSVYVFNQYGSPIENFCDGYINLPIMLAVDNNNLLFVLDHTLSGQGNVDIYNTGNGGATLDATISTGINKPVSELVVP